MSNIHSRLGVCGNIGIIGRVCPVDVNKTHEGTDVDEQMY